MIPQKPRACFCIANVPHRRLRACLYHKPESPSLWGWGVGKEEICLRLLARLSDNLCDLVIIGPKQISRQILIQLQDAFQESNLPFRVDILDWHQISEEFKEIIAKNFVVIQPSSP